MVLALLSRVRIVTYHAPASVESEIRMAFLAESLGRIKPSPTIAVTGRSAAALEGSRATPADSPAPSCKNVRREQDFPIPATAKPPVITGAYGLPSAARL